MYATWKAHGWSDHFTLRRRLTGRLSKDGMSETEIEVRSNDASYPVLMNLVMLTC